MNSDDQSISKPMLESQMPAGHNQPQSSYLTNQGSFSGMALLESAPALFIEQKLHWVQSAEGLKHENTFYIYSVDKKEAGSKGKRLMKAKEKSSWFVKNCLTYSLTVFFSQSLVLIAALSI